MLSEPAHHLMRIPLMHDYQAGPFQFAIRIQIPRVVKAAVEVRKCPVESFDRLDPVFGNQVLETPAIARFENAHFMTAGDQLRGHAAQEMRVSVIPVGDQGMCKYD